MMVMAGRAGSTRTAIAIGAVLTISVAVYFQHRTKLHDDEHWRALKAKRASYSECVEEYRDCRGYPSTKASFIECIIAVQDYAQTKEMEDEFKSFLVDLDETRLRLKAEL